VNENPTKSDILNSSSQLQLQVHVLCWSPSNRKFRKQKCCIENQTGTGIESAKCVSMEMTLKITRENLCIFSVGSFQDTVRFLQGFAVVS